MNIDVDALTVIAKVEQTKTLMVCERVSYLISLKFGYEMVYGEYVGPEVEGMTEYNHWWNVTEDGTIIDATSNQFGYGRSAPPVRIVPPDDKRQSWYLVIP